MKEAGAVHTDAAAAYDARDWIMQYPFGWIEMWLSTTPVVAAGMVSFVLANLFYTATGVLSRLLSKSYNKMTLRDQHRWNSGFQRATGGLMLGIRGFYCLYDGLPADGLVWGTNSYLHQTAAFALGFFLFEVRDSLHLYLACGIFQETLVVHHTCGVVLYVVALATGAYHFPVGIVLIEELCAPMVHLGWVLAKLQLDNHWLWDVNQYMLIVFWVICRNGIDIILWYYLLTNFFEVVYGPTLAFIIIFPLLGLLSFILNPFWLRLKIAQIGKRNEKYQRSVTSQSDDGKKMS
eukprot:m.11717 g.11717  ORF g.11717 m.11717 type:complete len:292 (-) comp2868_c0_seq1:164-1039(-)